MESSTIQNLLDKAFSDGSICFEISSTQQALVISIPEGSDLIRTMDDLWLSGKELLIPLDKRGKINPTPTFKIGNKFTVSPTYRQKRVRNGHHLYDFIYTPKA
jgi:hypothetical protein